MSKQLLTKHDLYQFTGSLTRYRHPLFGYCYTEGVRYVALRAGAYWLLDAIYSWQTELAAHEIDLSAFQIWTLTVSKDQTAVLTCQADSDQPEVARQEIEYTDFPLDEIRIYVIDGVMLLPSEY